MGRKRRQQPAGEQREFFARCAGGFEEVLGKELRALRLRRVRPQVGGVIFFGSLEDAYRSCLWSSVATRIQLVLARVPATDADALYRGVYDLPWEKHIPQGATIAVDAHGENPELRNTKFTALKVKDALCDRLRERCGVRPDVSPKDPDLAVNVAVHPQKATVYLNLSGASLHRRGYREEGVQTEAPLKETLAAGILWMAGWPELAREGGALVDPMCGSGTFAIEAALMASGTAPGLLRTRWGFEAWAQHDQALWEHVVADARARRQAPDGIRILAGDCDPHAIEIARANARRAGVEELIQFYVDDAARLGRHLRALRGMNAGGLLVANPPYGLRLLSGADLPAVNAALSQAIDVLDRSWRVALITPDTSVDTALGRTPATVCACHNGPIEAWVRTYELASKRQELETISLAGIRHMVPVAEPNSAPFAARLRKVAKERARWARRSEVSCYRVYDADLPDYALAIDYYQGLEAGQERCLLVVEEHRRPASVDAQRAGRRLADAAALAAATFDVQPGDVLVRAWGRGRDAAHRYLLVSEGASHYDIDVSRPDAAQFLAQRGIRELAGSLACKGSVAALFASSGAALVPVLAAGAPRAVLVDEDCDWLDGAKRMLEANGYTGKRCAYAASDVRTWLAREKRAGHRYDLLICVAPPWLPARDEKSAGWDLARDHLPLLQEAAGLLARGGTLLFACDGQDLRLDYQALEAVGLSAENVSGRIAPHDFERSKAVPRCWLLHR